ncbi:Dabb family protein [Fontisphaera persica]|uniref:Dabb family protein n=1 Tax=Fontisphaera persica TaxID=2974023 RepID=UPI0024BFF1A1|nr:Dabb family protein [Fontisphaera persica]WCJ58579.1 Dabb family protein [Fontisphaera persica]
MMKRSFFLWAAALMLAAVMNVQAADSPKKGLLRHVVIFKYKETVSAAEIERVEAAFRALKKSIPGIVSFESGVNVSPENLNKGFTHCYILTFRTEKDRDAYLVHPEHQKFVDIVKPVLAEPLVIDFWVREK